MFNKKGDLVIYVGIVFLISAMVFVVFYSEAKEQGTGEFLFKAAVARDIALLLEGLYAAPGDVEFIYPTELSGYGVKVQDNIVSVFYSGMELLEADVESYGYVGIGEERISENLDDIFKLKFIKKDAKIRIEPITDGELTSINELAEGSG